MDAEKTSNFLAEQRDAAPDSLQHYFLSFEDYWERKLWHELTTELLQFYAEPESAKQRLPIYNSFIKGFADKINQLQLVRLGLSTAEQCKDDTQRLTFLSTLANRVNKPSSPDAYLFALTSVAATRLALHDTTAARADLDACERILDTFDAVDPAVHASFYRVRAASHHAAAEYAAFYRTTLLYLACVVDLDSLPLAERRRIAQDLALAALVSDELYNFGELLLHPILSTLEGTPQAWLRELLFAFNRGDPHAYTLLQTHVSGSHPSSHGHNHNHGHGHGHSARSHHQEAEPLLKAHLTFLHLKLSLASLTHLISTLPPHNRSLPFSTLSQQTRIPENEIEFLVMKALALGLVKGSIDQVGEVARIEWVQPRVLERAGIEGMRDRLAEWDGGVERLGNWIEGVGRDVWAA